MSMTIKINFLVKLEGLIKNGIFFFLRIGYTFKPETDGSVGTLVFLIQILKQGFEK